jgi:glyceraldehyde 3-phosphate dehydrogenase
MGFGMVGRQLYQHALEGDVFEVAAISDVGSPEILHYLLTRDVREPECRLEHNRLVNDKFSTRMLRADRPHEVPWDAFDVDAVIDATARFRSRAEMQAHLDNGAHRVLISTLPLDHIDRLVIPGINERDIRQSDRMISAGSASTTAMALVLRVLSDRLRIAFATMTSVHAYTSDQVLQDYAGADYRRSRSGAENIIPNISEAPRWVEHVLPQLAGKLSGYALNVPVQKGSLLDLSIVFEDEGVTVKDVNGAMIEAAEREPDLIGVARDPIVSSDVIGCWQSVLFDLHATMKAGKRMIKTLSWHESRGHANRILDVLERYARLDQEVPVK